MKHHSLISRQPFKFISSLFVCLFIILVCAGEKISAQTEPLFSNTVQGEIINGERIDKSFTFFSSPTTLSVEINLNAKDQSNQLLIEIITTAGVRLLKWQVSSDVQNSKVSQKRIVQITSPQDLTLRIFGLRSNPEGSYKILLNGINVKQRDSAPPVIKAVVVADAASGAVDNQGILKGQISDESAIKEVRVNDQPIQLPANGEFSFDLSSLKGMKEVTITASDIYGNNSSRTLPLVTSTTVPQNNSSGQASIRGAENIRLKIAGGQTRDVKLYKASYALVIGAGEYTAGWDKLPGVASDTIAVKAALERQGFEVILVPDPKKSELIGAIQNFIDEYGYDFENRLLIYFAGHGYTNTLADGRSVGYIVPVDAPLPSVDRIGFERKAIENEVIESFAKQIRAKHALFLFDSCFSGKLVSRGEIIVPPNIVEEVSLPVRQFITAGAANQEVPDESVFRRLFVRGLDGEADEDKDGYILGSELARYLKREVTNHTNRAQTPQYNKILNLDLNQGDFVFIVPDSSVVEAARACRGETTPLKIVSKPRPNYTDKAREEKIEGTIKLRVVFKASGQIGEVVVVEGLGGGLNEQAVAAVKQIKFIPVKNCGTPQTETKFIEYIFSLY